jgi:hypothetical protein
MLNYKYPEHTNVGKYLGNFSQHKRPPHYSVGKEGRFGVRDYGVPGPGTYRTECDHPENEKFELLATVSTKAHVVPRFSIPTDTRVDEDGNMKGLYPKVHKLGPGQYESKIGVHSRQGAAQCWSIPKAAETPEAIRERKKFSQAPGPGNYKIDRYGDEFGKEKQKAMEKALRRSGRNCWAESQYSHIFACMKPRGSGLLPAVGSAQALGESASSPELTRSPAPSSPAA